MSLQSMMSDLPMADGKVDPIFKTCGLQISLNGVNMPDEITIKHDFPEVEQHDTEKNNVVTINIGGKSILGNRALLSARIPFFHGLFNSEMKETIEGEINLSNELCELDSVAIEHLINCALTGSLTISTSNVQDLMMAANFFGMKSVLVVCANFMRRRLTIYNIFSVLHFSRTISYDGIDSYLLGFIDLNFVPLSFTEEFLELQFDDFERIVQRDSLRVDEEDQVFEAVTRWIENEPEREKYSERLLKCIRCPVLKLSFVTETMEKSNWVMNTPRCVDLVNIAKVCIKSEILRKHCTSFKTTERLCEDAQQFFLSFLDEFPDHPTETYIRLYNPITNTWTVVEHQRKAKTQSDREQLYYHRGMIYFARSKDNGTYDLEVFETWDTTANQWQYDMEFIEKNTPRFIGVPAKHIPYSVVEFLNGKNICRAGGVDDHYDTVSDAEAYDEAANVWRRLPSMSKPRSLACSGTINGKFYVIGGAENMNDGTSALDCGECFDPQTNRWTRIRSMHYMRMASASLVYKNHIYITGGLEMTENMVLNTVERYDPVTNTWTELKSCDNWADDGSVNLFKDVEMYDPETDTWEDREPMPEQSYCVPLFIPATFPLPVSNLEGEWMSEFRAFSLRDELYRAIVECGFLRPTEVQSQCIPQAINGLDVICHAESGSGKTSTYVIATLQQIEPIDGEVSVLVICPTGQKALHIEKEYKRFSKYLPALKAVSFTGERSIEDDEEIISKNCPQIAIGTPERILKVVQSGALKLDKIKHLLLADCDRMICDYVFPQFRREQNAVKKILKASPKDKQMMVFTVVRPEKLHCTSFMRVESLRF